MPMLATTSPSTAPGRTGSICRAWPDRVRILRAADCRTTPWKNGGGSTQQMAIGPAGASLDNFDWRISMARVATDGPFSDFPGIDRTLTVIEGGGMELTIGNDAPLTLSKGTAPVNFAGDMPTSARLTAG